MGKQSLVHGLLLFCCCCVVVGGQYALKKTHARHRIALEKEAKAIRIRELLSRWNALAYQDARDEQALSAALAHIDWPSLHLTGVQEQKAREAIQVLLRYLTNPSFDQYLALKSGALHRFHISSEARKLLSRSSVDEKTPLDEKLRYLWNSANDPGSQSRLTGIAVQSLKVSLITTNSLDGILRFHSSKGFIVLRSALDVGFTDPPAAEWDRAGTDSARYIAVSFYGRSNRSTNGGPLYLSFEWDARSQSWIPSKMFTDKYLAFETLL